MVRVAESARWTLVLFTTLATAKLCVAGPERVFESVYALCAWWGPDAILSLAAWPLLLAIGCISQRLAHVTLALACVWTAIAVPIAITLGTPPTWSMIAASGGPLRDSIQSHLHLEHAAWITAVLISSISAAYLWRRSSARAALLATALLIPLAVCSAAARAEVATRGLERNALWTILVPAGAVRLPQTQPVDRALLAARAFVPRALDPAVQAWRGAFRGASLVVIILESASSRALGAWGASEDAMPTLSAMARAGLRAEATYAAYPESIRGLLALFFGLHPAPGFTAGAYRSLHAPSLASLLETAGYANALFHSGYFDYLGMDAILHASRFALAEDAESIGGSTAASFGIPEERTIDHALRWIEALDPAQPFSMVYMPIAGHHPYATPVRGPFRGGAESVAWRNALHHADQCVAQLIAGLTRIQRQRPLLVAVVGDHGQAFGEHPHNYGHSFFLYEENLRVPLFFFALGIDLPAAEIRGVSSHVDLLPTLLDLLAIETSGTSFDGRSLLRGEEGAALFFADYGVTWMGLREGRWKWMQDLSSGRAELYDLSADPAELVDLATRERERSQGYEARAQAWWGAQQVELVRLGASSR